MSSEGKSIRAAVYLRQSLDATGERLAVQRQREQCQRIARERGWTVVGEYLDNSISASDKRKPRPGYDRLVRDYAAGTFEALLCYDLDRLTRQPRQLEDWIDAAEGRGLRLVTANGEADLSTDGGRMYARIKAAVARAEIERKAARQRAAAAQRAEHGRPPLGPRLTGYTPAGDLVADEAERVRGIFERFAAGDSLRSLAAWLAETGVPTRRGGRWNPSSVSAILRNPRYAGRAIYDGAETGQAGNWHPIVDDDTFALVQARLRDPRRKTNHHGYDRKYLGSGLYLCGVCEATVVSHTARSAGGPGYVRYRCRAACLVRSAGPVDDYVERVIRGVLGRPDLVELLPMAESGQARALGEEASRLRGQLARVEQDYDDDLIDGRRYQVKRDKIRAGLAGVESRMARLGTGVGSAGAVLLAADPVATYGAAPLMLQRGVVDALCVVRLLPAPRGSRTFRPESVQITPRAGVRTGRSARSTAP